MSLYEILVMFFKKFTIPDKEISRVLVVVRRALVVYLSDGVGLEGGGVVVARPLVAVLVVCSLCRGGAAACN